MAMLLQRWLVGSGRSGGDGGELADGRVVSSSRAGFGAGRARIGAVAGYVVGRTTARTVGVAARWGVVGWSGKTAAMLWSPATRGFIESGMLR